VGEGLDDQHAPATAITLLAAPQVVIDLIDGKTTSF
jgi:hypothetical protein